MKMILNDGSVIENLVDGLSTTTTVIVELESASQIEEIREKLTEENLTSFKFVSDDNEIIFATFDEGYTNTSVSYSVITKEDLSKVIMAHFNLVVISPIDKKIKELENTNQDLIDCILELSDIIYA